MTSKRQDIFYDITQIQKQLLDGRLFCQLPNPRDDIARAVGIVDYLPQRFSNFFKVRSTVRQEADTSIGVVDDCGEWLVDFMGYGGSQFAHGGHTRYMSELRLRLMQRSSTLARMTAEATEARVTPYLKTAGGADHQ